MPSELRATRLPGVGMKYTSTPVHGGRLAMIMHTDGMRELYFFRRRDDDEPVGVLHLEDDEARQVAAALGGAYERPKIVEELRDGDRRARDRVGPGPRRQPGDRQDARGDRLPREDRDHRDRDLREPEPIAGAQPNDVVQEGDVLVTVGKLGQYREFRRLLAEGSTE